MELRVYAEDPKNNFLPDIGRLNIYKIPQGPGVRVDDGFEQGMDIPIYYDPMIAKLVTYADNRENAIERMIRAIDEYTISGIETTLEFGKYVLGHEAFTSGNFDTKFVEKYFTPDTLNAEASNDEKKIAAALALKLISEEKKTSTHSNSRQEVKSNWVKRKW